MSHEVIIETRNLTKVYRDFWGRPKVQALKALDLQVHRGEIFGLLGPNGSGKTTTIKLLLGLLFPTEGDALIFNEPTTNVAKNERIGYLPEESYLYKFLNAEETLEFYGRLFKIPGAERNKRVGQLIDMVGLLGGQAPPAPRVLQGHAAPHRPGPGPDQQPRADPARRADLGPRPDRHRRDQGPDPRAARAGQDDRPVQPPAGRHAGHLRSDRDPPPRRAQGAGQGHRPADGPGRHPDQGAQPVAGGPGGDPRRDPPPRRRGPLVDHPTTTLEELFLRIVRESELHPGRRKVAHDGAGIRPAPPVERRSPARPSAESPPRSHAGAAHFVRVRRHSRPFVECAPGCCLVARRGEGRRCSSRPDGAGSPRPDTPPSSATIALMPIPSKGSIRCPSSS